MTGQSRTVVDALNSIRSAIAAPGQPGAGDIQYPNIARGPVEEVIAFNNNEHITLAEYPANPHFSSQGPLTDLHGNLLSGTYVETTFPVNLELIQGAVLWPLTQPPPFLHPPLYNENTTGHGYSKQAYFFNDRKDYFVTVGPSLPKIVRTKNGGAQFWVGSIGVIAQGVGKYEGARGVTTYVGSGYFERWPDNFDEQAKLLTNGFSAWIGTFVKVVLKENVAS
jgi:hypothetical protein